MTAVILKDGTRVPTDMVVVGIGIRANTALFDGQLAIEKGGIKVNGRMQTSNSSVYAVGDVAAFPVKLFGSDIRRLEHVDSARKTAKHAVAAIMAPEKTADFDYLPFFYSRVFSFSWQFYGDNVGQVIHYGDFLGGKFGAYWLDKGRIIGAFLEGGNREEYEAIAKVVKRKTSIKDVSEVERRGLDYALRSSQQVLPESSGMIVERPMCNWHAAAGVAVAISISAFAFWYGSRRRRW